MSYNKELNSPAKKIMRVLVYDEVRIRLAKNELAPNRIMIMPGPIPNQEILLAKSLLNAHVTAIDEDPVAVEIARSSGADTSMCGNVAEISLDNHFDFSNLDTTANVRTPWVGEALGRASKTSKFIATWFSYGRELSDAHIADADRHQIETKIGDLRRIPNQIRNRVCFVWKQALWSETGIRILGRNIVLRPLKIWTYTHGVGGARMFVTLWATDPQFYQFNRVELVNVHSGMFHEYILQFAKVHGMEKALQLFNCSTQQLIAWKAVQTARTRHRRK